MFKLYDIFKIYVNRNMTVKTLDLNCDNTSEIIELEKRVLLKAKMISVPTILKCSSEILNQYYLVVFPLDDQLLRIAFYLFKKKYDYVNENFCDTYGICKKHFVIDFTIQTQHNKNWREIHNKSVAFDEINICYLEEHNIKLEEYANYLSLYQDPNTIDFHVSNIWGETIGVECIDWIITLENIIKKDYGLILEEEYELPKFNTFVKKSINQIYYPFYNINCYLYKYINQYSIFKCDNCHKFFGSNQKEKDIWHNYKFGDICNSCYNRNKKDYFLNLSHTWKILLQRAKKKLFEIELRKTKRFLNHKKIPQLNLEKKNLILNNVIREILRDRKAETCGICLDKLIDNIKAGSCGHCFHSKCLESVIGNKCPICRKETEFIKLHI